MYNKIQKLHHVPDLITNHGNVNSTESIIKDDYEYNDLHEYKMHIGDGASYVLNYMCAKKWQFKDEDMLP